MKHFLSPWVYEDPEVLYCSFAIKAEKAAKLKDNFVLDFQYRVSQKNEIITH